MPTRYGKTTGPTKQTGGGCPPGSSPFFGWCIPLPDIPIPDPIQGAQKLAKGAASGALGLSGSAITGGLKGAGAAFVAWIKASSKGHAWEWVIGGAMLFVMIGSAKRIAEGGQ